MNRDSYGSFLDSTTLLTPPVQMNYRIEENFAVAWKDRLPYELSNRMKLQVMGVLDITLDETGKTSRRREDIVYEIGVNLFIHGHKELDMIIDGNRYPIIEQFGDYFVVIIGRDIKGRNEYGFFHRNCDTREREYGPEF